MATKVPVDTMITVGNLADSLNIPVTKLIMELMKNGIMATVNELIDFDTAQIVTGDLGLDIELVPKIKTESDSVRQRPVNSKDAVSRPPVVAVMGHVDHGKTSLLDAIRGAKIVEGEAGGITQHIAAYQVEYNKRMITLLDTPGHEAFAALREHGAHLTDLVVIVVAADDGVKPQTVEAIRFARKAGVKIIVAINKIDKDSADLNRVKQELSEQGLLIEEWGGDIVVVPVSAKTKTGITDLLDMILLVSDVEGLLADVDVPGEGLIIEAHMEQGRGPVAEVLVETGTVRPGQFIVAGSSYARIRNLESTNNKPIKIATPSTPAIITGFKTLPEFGHRFNVVDNEKAARIQTSKFEEDNKSSKSEVNSSELIRMINRSNKVNYLNIIIKADVKGSLTSVIDSLKSLDTEEVAVRVVGTGVGSINENDLYLASSSSAIIYGFNVSLPTGIRQLTSRDKISVRLYNVIYELIDDVKIELESLLAPEVIETEQGRLVVKAVFKSSKTEIICGGEVTKGKISTPSLVRVLRDKEILALARSTNLKRGPQDAKEIIEGEMCGVSLATDSRVDLQEGDRLEFFTQETVQRKL
ncbi:translation initiation factor IF-2 [Candidatus Saccharibacteria bacterium]|jgi:translation initiation factor IF-2|nr:translation initiation factor IF-2 [Candidatus Saccharibacteria bacterium]